MGFIQPYGSQSTVKRAAKALVQHRYLLRAIHADNPLELERSIDHVYGCGACRPPKGCPNSSPAVLKNYLRPCMIANAVWLQNLYYSTRNGVRT